MKLYAVCTGDAAPGELPPRLSLYGEDLVASPGRARSLYEDAVRLEPCSNVLMAEVESGRVRLLAWHGPISDEVAGVKTNILELARRLGVP